MALRLLLWFKAEVRPNPPPMPLTYTQVRPLFSVWIEGQMFCPLTPICFPPVCVCGSSASSERCPLAAAALLPPCSSAPLPLSALTDPNCAVKFLGAGICVWTCSGIEFSTYIYAFERALADFTGWNILQSFLLSILYFGIFVVSWCLVYSWDL